MVTLMVTAKRLTGVTIMPLTDLAIRNAKPKEKPYKLADGGNLFLLVQPNGSKWWRYAYRFHKKQKLLALGSYPETSLAEAREKHAVAHKQVPDAGKLFDDGMASLKVWSKNLEAYHADAPLRIREDTLAAILMLLQRDLGEKTAPLIDKVVPNWERFIKHVQVQYAGCEVPPTPDIHFFYYFRRCAVSFEVVQHCHDKAVAV
jgi:hypothetical protein